MTTKTEPHATALWYRLHRHADFRSQDLSPQAVLRSYQVFSKSSRYQFVVCRPRLGGNLLFNLKAHRWIQLNSLQITKHDPDYVGLRKRTVTVVPEIFLERSLWRRYDHVFLGPELAKRGVAAALHVGLLNDNKLFQV